MNSEIIPKARRSRGRPRKSNSSLPNIAKSATIKQAPSYTPKRKQLLDAHSDEIQVIGFNGFDGSQAKKPKSEDLSDLNMAKRSLPHRAARFTESYGGTSPDVVIISDEEQGEDDSESDSDSDCGPIPSPVTVVKSKEELEQYENKIQHLKQVLCDEEMKLVLLKKLQDSQKTKGRESNSSPLPTPGQPAASKPSSTVTTMKSGAQIIHPSKQLISNSNKLLSTKKEMKYESTSQFSKAAVSKAPSVPSSSVKHPVKAELNDNAASSVSSNSAEKINASHLQQYPLLKNLSAQITITAVPPVGSPAPTNYSQPATISNSNKNIPTPAPSIKEEKGESLSQRQAAAKLALRKQLEKTLLQIPLPKPPPLKLNFFPNANSVEFLCLVGLDFVVDFLTKTKKSSLTNPLTCAQCSTDFTCAWKWKEVDKNGVKSYDAFCEACINSNIRKSLKAQHTNSLKAAFLKALHQEKEIDKLTSMPSKSHSPTPRESSRTHLPSPSPAHQNSSSMSVHSLPKHHHGAPVPYIPKVTSNMNHAAALAQMTKLSPQYQQLLQIQAQHLFATGVPLHPSMLSPFMSPSPNHLSRGKSSVPNDLRRQYRSDRVQSPSIPHSSSSWKT